ncbi:MAG: metallophosphoesterase [Methanobrevibacter sp.]|uniref:metallophosphoesterase n=1 Tax=Methanobrevibacter sp. TaxID=66852 RepID=UPI0026E06A1A|nr:metallophosphoesterase [Methanobrevibacter sp.]MDO5848139.1 metallophosphoesterase [Methanobrevibacter sp.]
MNDLECLAVSLTLSVLNVVCVYIEFVNSNGITRFIVEVLDSLNWVALMYLFLAIAILLFNYFVCTTSLFCNRLSLLLIVGLFIYGYYNAHTPKITERTLYLKNLQEEIDIIHLSDIHVGSIRRQGLLKKLSKKINSINSDAVIISGDLADGSNRIQPDDFKELGKIKSPVIFTPGNHDYYTGIENVFQACENAGIIILDNEKTEIKGLNIYGIGFGSEEPDFEISKEENNLLIYHLPANWDEFIERGFNIMLSGHTHGGQFYPANLWVKAVFPLLRGLYEKEGNYINVSDGAGTIGPPIRIGTKAEIGILKLRKRD